MSKVLLKIIKDRISKVLDNKQPKEQAGFRQGFSTIDHIFTMNQILEETKEYNMECNLVFIDMNKAFDSIYHKSTWTVIKNHNVPKKVIKTLKHLYANSTAHIRMDKNEELPINGGVKQGDPLSPNIFNSALKEVFWNLERV